MITLTDGPITAKQNMFRLYQIGGRSWSKSKGEVEPSWLTTPGKVKSYLIFIRHYLACQYFHLLLNIQIPSTLYSSYMLVKNAKIQSSIRWGQSHSDVTIKHISSRTCSQNGVFILTTKKGRQMERI